MKALKEVIEAVRREIRSALEEEGSPAEGPRLVPEKVVLSLAVHLREEVGKSGSDQISLVVADSLASSAARNGSKGQGAHTLTIEFQCTPEGALRRTPATKSKAVGPDNRRRPAASKLEGIDAKRVGRMLDEVFGAPGFDSSARASVFVEALQNLSDAQAASMMGSLDRRADAKADESTKRIRHRLNNVMRSGPLQSIESAGRILADLFKTFPASLILPFVRTRWKTQEEWKDTPPAK
jgi:hypothetical protein